MYVLFQRVIVPIQQASDERLAVKTERQLWGSHSWVQSNACSNEGVFVYTSWNRLLAITQMLSVHM